ncbi:hypothetical protein O6H91_18G069800 [Diphasiastrum complanatum]|uniref:Uncharacterized protein n=1 Tax=Diphasiastrum complanatum TaxID=34168 RepID=A0ACC2B2K0_DIPCM|nr:hypothetical protein O6H91_18G069800 [Diphasiastrum complanatum]
MPALLTLGSLPRGASLASSVSCSSGRSLFFFFVCCTRPWLAAATTKLPGLPAAPLTKNVRGAVALFGFGKSKHKAKRSKLSEVMQAGDPVLHEPAVEVPLEEISSYRIQKVIDDMVEVMREFPSVGLAAPQLGVPLQIIVLEDTEEYISYASREEVEVQQRDPFDLLVIINPKLKTKGSKTARFFEGCLSVNGYRALVERHLEVEVTGFGRDGLPLKLEAVGWKARILQHECDHLAGLLYVDKMIPRTFRTVENLRLPLPAGCPKPGVCQEIAAVEP